MKINFYKGYLWSIIFISVITFSIAGCGGGGSSGSSSTTSTTTTADTVGATTVSSLKVAEKVSVVDASSTSTKPALGKTTVTGLTIMDARYLPTGWATTVDYYKDPQFVYIHERSGEALNTPNEILCMMAQAKYDTMVNKGNTDGYYLAQIDTNLCSQNQDSSSNADTSNQSSGSTTPNYAMWTVRSIRADDAATTPQYVKAWVHETIETGPGGNGQEMLILADVKITEAASATNPYGLFTMNFAGYPYDKATATITSTTPLMKGTLKTVKNATTGKVNLQFWSSMLAGTETFSDAATLERSTDGTTGGGEVQFTDHGWDQTNMKQTATTKRGRFAFDTTTFKRQAVDTTSGALTGSPVCLDKTKFNYSVWSYGMYDSAGARVNLQSGFPIKFVKSGKDYFGYVGNYGIFFPGDVTLTDGDSVSKMDWSGGNATATPYTIKKTGGKLIKHTRNTTTLDKLDGIKLSYGYFDSTTNTFSNINLHWDNATKTFKKDSKWDMTTQSETELTGTLDISSIQWNNNLMMWSQSMGGQVTILLPVEGGKYTDGVTTGTVQSGAGCVPPNFSQGQFNFSCTNAVGTPATVGVVYFVEEMIYPKDSSFSASTSMTCYNNCPDGTKFSSTATGSVYHTQEFGSGGQQKSYTYTFDGDAYTLKEGTNSISVTTKNTNLSAGNFGGSLDFGIQTGPMFDPTATSGGKTYLALLACDWDANQVCAWDANTKLPEYYTWETGWSSWNTLTSLVASNGTVLKFDQEANVKFTYPSTATTINSTTTDTKYAGKAFQLQYGGFRQLWGIPGKCVGMDKGEAVACGPGTRYVPEFVIPDASEVLYSYKKSDGTSVSAATGYIKALDMEKQMQEATCGAQSLTAYTLLTSADWTAPTNSTTEPTITDPPAVIGGVVQKQ